MRSFLRIPVGLIGLAMIATAIGGCSSNQLADLSGVQLVPRFDHLSRPDWLSYSGSKDDFTLRPVTAADLVTQDGQCAMPPEAAAPPSDPNAPAQLVAGGISLQMTECDVVRRAGAPEQLQVGADERGERSVVITYVRGPRPGVYRFAAGRLVSIERAPGAPVEQPKKAKAKKAVRG
jgi:hypothetical protein